MDMSVIMLSNFVVNIVIVAVTYELPSYPVRRMGSFASIFNTTSEQSIRNKRSKFNKHPGILTWTHKHHATRIHDNIATLWQQRSLERNRHAPLHCDCWQIMTLRILFSQRILVRHCLNCRNSKHNSINMLSSIVSICCLQ